MAPGILHFSFCGQTTPSAVHVITFLIQLGLAEVINNFSALVTKLILMHVLLAPLAALIVAVPTSSQRLPAVPVRRSPAKI